MNDSQQIAENIKSRAKTMHISLREMLTELGLGINIISQFSKGHEMSCFNLAKIAEYLDCSVDYLLGRTENAKAHKTKLYPQEYTELLEKYSCLDGTDKIKIIERIDTLLEDEKYKKYISKPKEA